MSSCLSGASARNAENCNVLMKNIKTPAYQAIMPTTHGAETLLPLRHAIVTCRILFGCTFDEIERKNRGTISNRV